MHPRARRAISVALSVALHALLLVWVMGWTVTVPEIPPPATLPVRILEPRPPARAQAPQPKPPEQVAKAPAPEVPPPPPPAEAPPPEPERKLPLPEQIVSPPDAGRNEVPPDTRFKSDRDVAVDRQQVKRGEPKPGESAPDAEGGADPPRPKAPPPRQRPQPPAPRAQPGRDGAPGRRPPPPPQVAALPGLDRLMPNALQLAQEGYGQPPPPAPESAEARTERRLAGGNDGLFIPTGPIGTLDYLPDVREGDITLLNTKAEMFAPFVRRVALRVFQNFWISLKKDLGRSQLAAAETVEAEAVMDPGGEMIRFTVTKRSPRITLASDRRLQSAAAVGFFDRNPPPGARAEDGNIHFLFATRIQAVPSARGLAFYVELATGLR